MLHFRSVLVRDEGWLCRSNELFPEEGNSAGGLVPIAESDGATLRGVQTDRLHNRLAHYACACRCIKCHHTQSGTTKDWLRWKDECYSKGFHIVVCALAVPAQGHANTAPSPPQHVPVRPESQCNCIFGMAVFALELFTVPVDLRPPGEPGDHVARVPITPNHTKGCRYLSSCSLHKGSPGFNCFGLAIARPPAARRVAVPPQCPHRHRGTLLLSGLIGGLV
mmetsp:Transcript_86448/g.201122  ORF Transcript_86448/g.201122 Transcript_86448/m.201122 type:complete len:222 (-) Transcript_86448:212-877(-)